MTFRYPELTKSYRTYAEQKGFLLIYPRTQRDSSCWDVSSSESTKHDNNGDSHSIANMVRYALKKYSADPARVYATGLSSGAMMTQNLMATYPDIFAGGSAFAGVAAGCIKFNLQSGKVQGPGHSSPTSDQSGCPQGRLPNKPTEYWTNLVHEAYPGYTGPRPSVQLWHGTADPIVNPKNLVEALKQWSSVLGVSFSKNITGVPERGYTKIVYGDGTKLQAFSVAGAGHMLKIQPQTMFEFFGLT
jgi:acetylxylan esterase